MAPKSVDADCEVRHVTQYEQPAPATLLNLVTDDGQVLAVEEGKRYHVAFTPISD